MARSDDLRPCGCCSQPEVPGTGVSVAALTSSIRSCQTCRQRRGYGRGPRSSQNRTQADGGDLHAIYEIADRIEGKVPRGNVIQGDEEGGRARQPNGWKK